MLEEHSQKAAPAEPWRWMNNEKNNAHPYLLVFGCTTTVDLSYELNELSRLSIISGDAVGYSGRPGRFYELSLYFLKYGDENDYISMTQSESPTVRIMGAYCLIRKERNTSQKYV